MKSVMKFIHQVYLESTLVVWPTRKEVVLTSGLVVIFSLISSLFFFAVDGIISIFLSKLIG